MTDFSVLAALRVKDDLVPFRCCPLSSCVVPSLMVREDTVASSEDSTSAVIGADEAVGCTRAFLSMWQTFRRLFCRGLKNLVYVQRTSLGSTGRNTSSQHNQSGLMDELLS
ncbi:hypothetical protein TNCV_3318581 [Trichonephila clavipes]|nr:hypothetical protein TNCV_3318581 [Trichonephila clavipes]